VDKKRIKEEININMNWMPIRTLLTTSSLSKTRNYKSPQCDQTPNCWLKAFPATHSYITNIFSTIIGPKQMPDKLTTAYFPNTKVGLSNHQSVCPPHHPPTTLNHMVDFMKFGREIMPFKRTSVQLFLIPYLQLF
jgi:hypothetical protein